jgi:pimeloyl-ACP methyl ester carboxylesterase
LKPLREFKKLRDNRGKSRKEEATEAITSNLNTRIGKGVAPDGIAHMENERDQSKRVSEDLTCVRAGSGPPLILLHGLLGGSFCWRFNLPAFSKHYTTFAVDLPGFGETEVPHDLDCSMQTQAVRLLSWLRQSGLDSVDVVASSWGGGVALFLAALSPKVRSLVLAAPVTPWSEFGRERVRFFSGRLGGALLRLGMPFSRPLHLTVLQDMYGDPARIPPGSLEGYSRIMLRKGRAHNILNTLRCWQKDLEALGAAIEQVRAPSLLVWGTRDGAVDLRSSEILMQKLPECELAVLPGVGHLPFEEEPDEFNRLVLEFLERVAGKARPA